MSTNGNSITRAQILEAQRREAEQAIADLEEQRRLLDQKLGASYDRLDEVRQKGQESATAVEDLVEGEPVGELTLRGFVRPVMAYRVHGLKG
jgi:hypothetical protein